MCEPPFEGEPSSAILYHGIVCIYDEDGALAACMSREAFEYFRQLATTRAEGDGPTEPSPATRFQES